MTNFSQSYISLFRETHSDLAKSAGWFSPSEKEIQAIAKLAPKFSPELKNMTDAAGHVLKKRSLLNRFTSAFTGHDPHKVIAQHLAHQAKKGPKAQSKLAPFIAGGGVTAAGLYGADALSDSAEKPKKPVTVQRPQTRQIQQTQYQDPYAGFSPQEIALLELYYGGQYR